jgi:hypothetical protein
MPSDYNKADLKYFQHIPDSKKRTRCQAASDNIFRIIVPYFKQLLIVFCQL